MTRCPDCGGNIDIEEEVGQGDTVTCPECGVDLEVVSTNPVELRLAKDLDEDEDEEEWDEDESDETEDDSEEENNGFH
jgi:alpha-aminoadipate carrier protein LysW